VQIPFRQGIVRRPTVLTGPDWLQKTSLSGTSIDLNIGTESTIISFAHYGANYSFDEDRTIVGAWGGGGVGSMNGPLAAAGQTQYLFWDVDLGTGSLTRGWTLVPPINSFNEPLNPVDDMHWFDLSQNVMRVYKFNGVTGYWIDKVRLFAAAYDSSGSILPYALGSQVGINTGVYTTGNIILGTNNKPLKQSDGTFVTTETDLIIYQTSGQNVRFDMALMFAMAAEELPKYYLVKFLPQNRIALASSLDTQNFARGMVIADHHQEEMAQVISSGYVRNEQWSWQDSSINKPIFCGMTGEISLTCPTVGVAHIVGHIADATSIYLNFQSPIRLR
jgi:hypothetical protein